MKQQRDFIHLEDEQFAQVLKQISNDVAQDQGRINRPTLFNNAISVCFGDVHMEIMGHRTTEALVQNIANLITFLFRNLPPRQQCPHEAYDVQEYDGHEEDEDMSIA